MKSWLEWWSIIFQQCHLCWVYFFQLTSLISYVPHCLQLETCLNFLFSLHTMSPNKFLVFTGCSLLQQNTMLLLRGAAASSRGADWYACNNNNNNTLSLLIIYWYNFKLQCWLQSRFNLASFLYLKCLSWIYIQLNKTEFIIPIE